MNVGTIVAQLVLQNQMTPQLQTAIKDLQTASKKVENLGRDMIDFSSRMTALVTVPILAAGAAALKASSDFETSFTGVMKTVDGTAEELAVLSGEIRQMAKEIPVGVNQLNAIAESAGQLGVKKQNIKEFTETIAALTVTTNLTADAAANDFARIANITAMPQEQFSNLAAAVVDLGNKFASNEAEIVNYGKYLAGAGTTAGLTVAEILAVGTAASSAGVQAEAGGTAIQKVWIDITKAVSMGGGKLEGFARTAGKSAEEFSDMWRNDPAEAFTQFVEGLGESGEDAFGTLDDLKLMDARLVRTFMNIAASGDLMRRSIETGTTAFAANTAHTREAEKRYATLHSQLKMVMNQMNDAAITAGTALLPTLKSLLSDVVVPLVEWVARLAEAFAELPAPVRNTIVVIAALTAAIFPAIFVAGQMITAWATLTGMIPALATAMGSVVGVLTGPVGWVALGTALLLAWEPTRELIVDIAGPAITALVSGIQSAIAATHEWWAETGGAGEYLAVLADVISGDVTTSIVENVTALYAWATAYREASPAVQAVITLLSTNLIILDHFATILIEGTKQIYAMARAFEDWDVVAVLYIDALASMLPGMTLVVDKFKEWHQEAKRVMALPKIKVADKFDVSGLSTDDVIADSQITAAAFDEIAKGARNAATGTAELTDAMKANKQALEDRLKVVEALIASSKGIQNTTRALELLNEGMDPKLVQEMVDVAAQLELPIDDPMVERLAKLNVEMAELKSHLEAWAKLNIQPITILSTTLPENFGQQLADIIADAAPDAADQWPSGTFVPSVEYVHNEATAAYDAWMKELEKTADETRSTWDAATEDMASSLVSSLASAAINGGNVIEAMSLAILESWFNTMQQMLAEWIATQAKMKAIEMAAGGTGSSSVTGTATSAASSAASSYASAASATMGVVAVFAAVAYAWYNDNQHQYKQLRDTIGDLSKIFESLSDTLGQYLPAFASAIEVRKDGDRFRIKSGTDEGRAEYKYFDDAADAFSAAVLSSLREMLNEGSVFGPGRLGHLGEEAKKVIAGITDEIIQMGQKGVEWLERGLALAGELDNLGKSDFEITLAEARRQYEENIRLAAEYGLSLEKVAELYRRTLSDMEQSLRSRVEQYLPGYDPIGDEFERIRADNAAIQAEYAKQREALQKHIDQVIATIATIANGLPGGTGGGANLFQQYEQYMEMLSSIGLGGGGVQIIGDMIHELELIEQLGSQIGGGGGMSPDTVERIAQQRALLEDLLRQLELMPTGGLTEEEISQAEREARRRNRRGGTANTVNSDRERLTETMANRAFEIAANGMTELQRELANLNRQREQELLLAHGSAELIAQLNAQYVELEAAIRAANGQQVRDDFQAFMGIGQGPAMTLADQFTALRDRITEAGFTTERTTAMIARLTEEYERQAADIIAQGRTDAMAGVQPWIDQSEGVGGQERQVIDMLADFAAARQALVDLARDAEAAGQSTEWLAADIARLGRAQQTAANQLTLNFIGSLKALGANIPADKVMQLAQAQWQLAKAQAIAAAMALAAAGGFKGLTITLEEVLGWITGATFEMSDYYPDLQGFSNGITEVGDAASSAATDMANARDILMDYYNDMLTGPNSPLTIMDQYKVAQGNYAAALAAYQRDKSSENATALTQAADELLDLGAQVYGTATDYYMDLFNGVRGDIGALIGIQGNVLDGNDRFIAAANNTTNAVDRVANVIDMRGSRTNELLQDVLDATRERGDAPPISAGPTPGVVAGWRGR